MWNATRIDVSGPWWQLRTFVVCIRQIEVDRQENEHRFHRQRRKVPVVTLKRRTHLFAFLLAICQFAIMDQLNILPLGIITWCCSFAAALEMLVAARARHQREEYILRQQQMFIQERYETALFEYEVLKQSNKRIVIIEENGRPSAIVAID